MRLCRLRVGGNHSTRRKPTCPTWWPHDHLKCDARYRTRVAVVRGKCFTTAQVRQVLIYRISKIVPTLSSHASSSTLRAVIATLRLWSYNWATSFSIPHTENPATLARNITRSNLVLYNRPDCNEGETVIQWNPSKPDPLRTKISSLDGIPDKRDYLYRKK